MVKPATNISFSRDAMEQVSSTSDTLLNPIGRLYRNSVIAR